MRYQLLRINFHKLLLLVLASSASGVLAAYGLSTLDEYSSFWSAGVATGLFFGGGWLFNKGLLATQEPILITIMATELVEVNQCSGQQRRWPFTEIIAYRRLPQVRGADTLQLTLRGGRYARLSATNLSLAPSLGATQFDLFTQAFAEVWQQRASLAVE